MMMHITLTSIKKTSTCFIHASTGAILPLTAVQLYMYVQTQYAILQICNERIRLCNVKLDNHGNKDMYKQKNTT